MHEVDSDTCSRSMVATLGIGIVGASREGGLDNADGATRHPVGSATIPMEKRMIVY